MDKYTHQTGKRLANYSKQKTKKMRNEKWKLNHRHPSSAIEAKCNIVLKFLLNLQWYWLININWWTQMCKLYKSMPIIIMMNVKNGYFQALGLSFLVLLLLLLLLLFFYWPSLFQSIWSFHFHPLSIFEIIRFVRWMQFCHLTWFLVWNESESAAHCSFNYRSQWWMNEWKPTNFLSLSLFRLINCTLMNTNIRKSWSTWLLIHLLLSNNIEINCIYKISTVTQGLNNNISGLYIRKTIRLKLWLFFFCVIVSKAMNEMGKKNGIKYHTIANDAIR